MKRIVIAMFIVGLLISSVAATSFGAWSAEGDHWISTNDTHKIVMWNTSGTYSWPTTGNYTGGTAEYLIVGGGGGAGSCSGGGGGTGGGGAGGALNGTTTTLVNGTLTIVVGRGGLAFSAGGGASGENGYSSTAMGYSAVGGNGGGGGNPYNANTTNPGAGGGGSCYGGSVGAGGAQGKAGGVGSTSSPVRGGGGGGFVAAGASGSSSGTGGTGYISLIRTGFNTNVSGGGGGGTDTGTAGPGAYTFGAGNGTSAGSGTNAIAASGSGGGGCGGGSSKGGNGGSGLVMIKYQNTPCTAIYLNSTAPYGYCGGVQFNYNITPGMGDQTDYQMKFILSNATGTSGYYSGDNIIYTGGLTRADWADINVTSSTGVPLKFWIENNTQTATNATVWIKVPSISTANTSSGRWYFGNSTQSASTMDGLNTFPFWDDFNDGTLNSTQWSTTALTTATLSGGIATISTTQTAGSMISSKTGYGLNYTVRTRSKQSATTNAEYPAWGFMDVMPNHQNAALLWAYDQTAHNHWAAAAQNLGTQTNVEGTIAVDTNYHVFDVMRKQAKVATYVDGVSSADVTTNLNSSSMLAGMGPWDSGVNVLSDWFFVRKSLDTEPTTSTYLTIPTCTAIYLNTTAPYGYCGGTQFNYNITAGAGSQTNYPVKFTLSNSSGTSGYYSGDNVIYTGGLTRGDWADINVTDSSNAPLKFWIENGTTTSTNATLWIKAPSITTDNASVGRIYYGNATQSASTMDGLNTFSYWTDCLGSALNTSQETSYGTGATVTVSGGECSISSAAGQNAVIQSIPRYGVNYTFETRAKTAHSGASGSIEEHIGWYTSLGSTPLSYAIFTEPTNSNKLRNWNGASEAFSGTFTGWSAATYHKLAIKRNDTGQTAFIDDINAKSLISQYSASDENVSWYAYTTSGNVIFDWGFIRKSVDSEPITSTYTSPAVTGLPLSASFSQVPNPSTVSQSVSFTDTSTGSPATWNWTFGDIGGSNTSTSQNPTHTYTTAGNYTVLLNVSNSTGSFSTASAWHNVTNSSAFYPQDVWMIAQPTKTFVITDSSDGTPISVVQLYLDGTPIVNTTNGTGAVSAPFGLHYVSFVSDGYTSRVISYVFDTDDTTNVQLTKAISSGETGKINLLYPHEVRLIVVDIYGARLAGINVTATMANSTIENTNWFETLFGISSSATQINATTLNGYTDDYGSIVFPMISSGRYHLTLENASIGVSQTLNIYPEESAYTFVVATTGTAPVLNSGDYINISLTTFNASPNVYLNMTYNDTYLHTSDVTFFVAYPNQTIKYSQTFTSISGSNQSVSTSYAVSNVAGTAYVWGCKANTTTFGWQNKSSGITMKGTGGILYDPFVYKGGWY